MRGFLDKIARAFGWLDAAEFAIPAIIAALLLVVAPLLAFFYFFRTHNYFAAVFSGSLWILASCHCLRPRCASPTIQLGERDIRRTLVGHDVDCVMET